MDTQTDHGRRADGPFLDFLLEGSPSVRRLQLARAHRSAAPRLQRAQRPHFVRTHHHPLYTSTLVLCVLSDCPSLSVSACWGALALAGCTQQALTKLKMFSLMTSEPRRSIPCRTSLLEAGHYLSKGGRVGACAALTHPRGEAAPCTMKGRRAESPAHGKSQCLRGGSAP